MSDLLETWLPNVSMIWPEVWDATYETLYMVIVGAVIGYAIGLVLGLLLLLTRRGGLTQNVDERQGDIVKHGSGWHQVEVLEDHRNLAAQR